MDETFQQLASLDRLLHEPARLAIMTALMACENADFLFLQRLTGLSSGNLSVQITRLEEAEMLSTSKRFVEKRPNTVISLTESGKTAIRSYWEKLESLKKSAEEFSRDSSE